MRMDEDLAVEHRVRGSADDTLVQLAAHPVRLQVINRGVRVGELALCDRRESIDRTARALGVMLHAQVVARNPRTEGDADGMEARARSERHRAVAAVESLSALALN